MPEEKFTIPKVFKVSWTNYWRNIWLSTAATLIIVITLATITITALVASISNFAIKNVQSRVDISVYLNQQTTDAQITTIIGELQAMPEVASVNYISADQAYQDFKAKHANDQVIMNSLNELTQNPLPATLQIKAKQLDQYQTIANALTGSQYQPYIQKVNFEDNRAVIERLSNILNTAKKTSAGLAIILLFISVLVIFNTIRLAIFSRREEVEIMRLVGATNWFIRWPFIIESCMYGLFASIVVTAAFWPLLNYISVRVNSYIGTNQVSYTFLPIWQVFLAELIISLVIGVASSFVAIRRYLKI